LPYKINFVRLQGIRGFNKAEEFNLSPGLTLLHGRNGSGKSSLLQSIEWALTGKVSYMKGGDFAREDAIVNLFAKSKRASVQMELSDGGPSLSLIRTRKMGTKTSTGKQPLEFTVGTKSYEDDDAEAELERILNISLQEFSQNKYLHQETLREILQAKPEDRSQAIDKLLGTYEVREFTKTIDADLQINKATNRIQETIDSLNRDKVQFLLNLKRSLLGTRTSLLKKKHFEEDLTLAYLLQQMEQIIEESKTISTQYSKPFPSIHLTPQITSLGETHSTLQAAINDLDRARLDTVNKTQQRKTNLSNTSTRYDEAYKQLKDLGEVDTKKLNERLKQIKSETATILKESRELQQKLILLPTKRTNYESAKKNYEKNLDDLAKVSPTLSRDHDKRKSRVAEIEKIITQNISAVKAIRGNLSILPLKREKYENAKSLLDTNIKTLKNLNEQASDDLPIIKTRAHEIEEAIKKLSMETKEIQQKLSSFRQKWAKFEVARQQLEEEQKRFAAIIEEKGSEEQIDAKISEINESIGQIDSDTIKLQGHQRLINLAIEQLEASEAEKCPVCSNPIDGKQLAKDLRSQIKTDLAAKLKTLKAEESQLKSTLETLLEAQKLIQRLQTTLISLQKKYDEALHDIHRILPDFKPEQVIHVQQDWENTLKTSDDQTKTLQAEEELIDRLVPLFAGLTKASNELSLIVPDFESKDLNKIQQSWEDEVLATETQNHALESEQTLIATTETSEKQLTFSSDELNDLIPDFETKDLDQIQSGWDGEIKALSGKDVELHQEETKAKSILSQFEQINKNLPAFEVLLRKETGSELEGPDLIVVVEELIKDLDAEIASHANSSTLDELRSNLSRLTDIISYLIEEERVNKAEAELPTVQKQIDDLTSRENSLKALAATLDSIRQLSILYEKEASIVQLKRLEDEINHYYSMMQVHPHFTQIKIDIEKEDPLIFSFKAAGQQDDTYIPTRFSTAQFNAAAISIFMSNSTTQPGELPIIILDDPTQNMDREHKEAFAKLVSTLTPRFQTIIATEDDETMNSLKDQCKDMKTYELGEWTPAGPEVSST
jgi:DNA repair protein SbcC/Rad50